MPLDLKYVINFKHLLNIFTPERLKLDNELLNKILLNTTCLKRIKM